MLSPGHLRVLERASQPRPYPSVDYDWETRLVERSWVEMSLPTRMASQKQLSLQDCPMLKQPPKVHCRLHGALPEIQQQTEVFWANCLTQQTEYCPQEG
jgi:hypothetical protein